MDEFTAREKQIYAMIRDGKTDRVIAAELCLTPRTISGYVGTMLSKTGASNRTAMVVKVGALAEC